MTPLFRGAGLFGLQVNGYAGVDFNEASLTANGLDHALEAMLASGVTGYLPTLITATREDLAFRIRALDAAVAHSRLGPTMDPGYHLEGPFLNDAPGYAGCHPPGAMTDPDADYGAALGLRQSGPILLVTLAPERVGAPNAIRTLMRARTALAIDHSAARFDEVRKAADAGLTLSTHLGNGLPQSLPKLDNTLLAQLSQPRLAACDIADGIHMSPVALRALIRLKGAERGILVTDAVLAAAAPPGRFRFAGMIVERTREASSVSPPRAISQAPRCASTRRCATSWPGTSRCSTGPSGWPRPAPGSPYPIPSPNTGSRSTPARSSGTTA